MKKILKFTAILLIVAGSFSSCGEEEKEFGEPKEISFTEYSLVGTSCQWTNLDYEEKVIVVNSNEELAQYITCTEGSYPEIDFSKNTLLLARGVATSGISKISKGVLKQNLNSLIFKVNIEQNGYAVMENWWVSVLVLKISKNSIVKLDLTITKKIE